MVFVADKIPPELRKVVEYLNSEMKSAEVLALELRPYRGEGGLRALASILMGQTQKAIEQKTGPSGAKPRREWDDAQIIDELERYEPRVPVVAKQLIKWMKANADRTAINDAPVYGSIGPEFMIQGQPCSPLRFWTDGSIALNFGDSDASLPLHRDIGFGLLLTKSTLLAYSYIVPNLPSLDILN